MKKLIYILFYIGVLATYSCQDNWLNQTDPNNLTSEAFWKTPSDVQMAVNSLYPSIGSLYSSGGDASEIPIVLSNSRGDDVNFLATQFASYAQYSTFTNIVEGGVSDHYWGTLFDMVFKANSIIANIDKADWTGKENIKDQLLGEANFFRGVAYFYLAHLYGRVPILTTPPTDESSFHPAKSETIEEVYDQAIEDLANAKLALLDIPFEEGRINKNVATAFLGKTYLYRAGYLNDDSYYASAATEFGELVGKYSLVNDWVDNFTSAKEYNSESVYEVDYKVFAGSNTALQGRPGITSVPGIGSSFMVPSEWLISEMSSELDLNGNYDTRMLNTIYFDGGLPLFGVEFADLGSGIYCNGSGGGSQEPSDTEGWECEFEDWGWGANFPQVIQDKIKNDYNGQEIMYFTTILCEREDPNKPGEWQEKLIGNVTLLDGTVLSYSDELVFLGADDSNTLEMGDCEGGTPVWCVEYEGGDWTPTNVPQFVTDYINQNYNGVSIKSIYAFRLRERPIPNNSSGEWEEALEAFIVLDSVMQDGSGKAHILVADSDIETIMPLGIGTVESDAFFRKYLNVDLTCEDPGLAENNERVIRYADVLLMYAEAIVKSGGSLENAINAVNEVRGRANLSTGVDRYGNPLTASNIMAEIEHQRVMEFALEGHRIFDLMRWNKVSETLEANGKEDAAANYTDKHRYFPIPYEEIINNTNMEQNQDWE